MWIAKTKPLVDTLVYRAAKTRMQAIIQNRFSIPHKHTLAFYKQLKNMKATKILFAGGVIGGGEKIPLLKFALGEFCSDLEGKNSHETILRSVATSLVMFIIEYFLHKFIEFGAASFSQHMSNH